MDLHDRMRVARLAAGLSQSQVARLLNVTPHTVYRYERQALTPSLSHLARLARELGVSIDWLVTGDGKGPEPRQGATLATGTEG